MTTTKSRQSTDDHLTDEVPQNAHDLPRNASSANATPASTVQKPLSRKDVCGLLVRRPDVLAGRRAKSGLGGLDSGVEFIRKGEIVSRKY